MTIEFSCSRCGHRLRASGDAAGSSGECQQCGERVAVSSSVDSGYQPSYSARARESCRGMALPEESVGAAHQGSITFLFHQLRTGDAEAAGQIWEHFAPRMVAVARKTLAGRPQRVTDFEDAAQSAFASFWTRATAGEFLGEIHRDNLWRLLITITVRKALKHQERERALKRGSGKVVAESTIPGPAGEPFQIDKSFAALPAKDFDMFCEELLLQLDEDLRSIALLKLMSHKNREIALLQGCSLSTIERKLQLIRQCWQEHLQ